MRCNEGFVICRSHVLYAIMSFHPPPPPLPAASRSTFGTHPQRYCVVDQNCSRVRSPAVGQRHLYPCPGLQGLLPSCNHRRTHSAAIPGYDAEASQRRGCFIALMRRISGISDKRAPSPKQRAGSSRPFMSWAACRVRGGLDGNSSQEVPAPFAIHGASWQPSQPQSKQD